MCVVLSFGVFSVVVEAFLDFCFGFVRLSDTNLGDGR